MASDYIEKTFDPAFLGMCERHFGRQDNGKPLVLHRRQLIKPSLEGPFACLLDDRKRKAFDDNCVAMYKNTDYTAIISSVDKVAFYNNYPHWNGDFYSVAVESAIERFFYFLKDRNTTGDIIIEAKSKDRDRAVKETYRKNFQEGFKYIRPELIQKHFVSTEIKIMDKKAGIPSLQLADMLAAAGLSKCIEKYFDPAAKPMGFPAIVGKILTTDKLYRAKDGKIDGYGMVWRPKKT